jgi:hypothetical protein
VAPKEHWISIYKECHFLFKDNGWYFDRMYHSGNWVTRFLNHKHGIVDDVAKTKLEYIMIDYFPI